MSELAREMAKLELARQRRQHQRVADERQAAEFITANFTKSQRDDMAMLLQRFGGTLKTEAGEIRRSAGARRRAA